MAAARNPSSYVGGAVKDASTVGLTGYLVTILVHYVPDTPLEVAIALVAVGSAAFGFLRRLVENLLAHRRAGLISLAALVSLAALACGTTPTDRYYSALTTLAGAREAAIAYCRTPVSSASECTAIREAFFVPGDAAVEAMENARQATIAACSAGEDTPACKGAAAGLSRASAGVASVSSDLLRWLAARGVKP